MTETLIFLNAMVYRWLLLSSDGEIKLDLLWILWNIAPEHGQGRTSKFHRHDLHGRQMVRVPNRAINATMTART